MPTNANDTINAAIDRDFVDRIVRKVIARLQQSRRTTETNNTAASIVDQVVTRATIENIPGSPSQVFLAPGSVLTPSAVDAAKERGIEINRTSVLPPAQQPLPACRQDQQIIDPEHPQRAESVIAQLQRRGITSIGAQIVLSDTPAAEIHRCISTRACRAAMVTAVSDVERFQRELRPDTWVLDMGKMNLVTAVNVVARIAQLGN